MTRLALFLINQNTSVAKEYSYSPIFTPKMHTYTRYTHSALSSTNGLIHDEFYQGSREPINSGVCCLYTMRMSDAHMQTEYYVPSCCFSLGIHHPDLLCIVELCAKRVVPVSAGFTVWLVHAALPQSIFFLPSDPPCLQVFNSAV